MIKTTKMTSEFRSKFRLDELTILDFNHWVLSVRPQQPTLGSLVISLKRTCPSIGELLTQESEELSIVFSRTERLINAHFNFDKINYLCLMMVDEHVHFHVIPRYSTSIEFMGRKFTDAGWPGPPNLKSNNENEEFIVNEVYNTLNTKIENETTVIGYTTGVFDLFHVGHLNILKNAKAHCDYLVVGVTTDELAESRKGKKPIISLNERVEILKQIKYVDKVVIQSTMDKISAWKKEKFHKMFVGSDWKGTKKWNELEKSFKQYGVEIVYFPYTKSTSSTIIRKILDEKIMDENKS